VSRSNINVFTLEEDNMKSLLISAAVVVLALTACGKEPAKPAAPAVQPAPAAAPAAPAAPAGAMTQEEKEKMAKDLTDAAKSANRKGE